MPLLRIIVVDPPKETFEPNGIRLVMSSKEGDVAPVFQAANRVVFETDFEMKEDRTGAIHPVGPAVAHHGDKRRFVYLSWWGDKGGGYGMFRRLKVFFDQVPDFPLGEASVYEISVKGVDKRGGPACATSVPVPSTKP